MEGTPTGGVDPDVRLMLAVRDDVAGAFEELVSRFQGRLLGVLTHLLGDADAAEDVTQEVLLRVYRSRKKYRPTARFSTWLFTIANNLARNHRRGRGRRRDRAVGRGSSFESSSVVPMDALPGREVGASTQMRRVELSDVVRAALETLGEDQKLAVLLNKFEGMGYAEIASVMGRSEAAVKSLLARARYQLKEQLEPYLDEGRFPSSGGV